MVPQVLEKEDRAGLREGGVLGQPLQASILSPEVSGMGLGDHRVSFWVSRISDIIAAP